MITNADKEDRKMENERQDFFFVWREHGYPTQVCQGEFPMEVIDPHDGMLVFIDDNSSYENLAEAVRTLYNLGARFSRVWSSHGMLKVYYDEIPSWLQNGIPEGFCLAEFREIEFAKREVFHE